MKTKHTPGKWIQSHRLIPNGMYSTQVYTEDGRSICTIEWYPMPPVSEVIEGKKVSVTNTYREANAKLIAAAPDLLKALSDYVSYGDSVIAKEVALKAIKKATE